MKKLIIIVCSISVLFSATHFSSSNQKNVPMNYFYCEDELPFAHTAI